MIKIIINADDLGKNPTVNSAICRAMDLGVITSSTIMANTEYMEEVKNIIKKHPECSFGIHLNLTEGRCLVPSNRMRSIGLIDEDGNFTKRRDLINVNDKKLLHDIEIEFKHQIQVLLANDIIPSHIDGHHHVHTLFCLRKIIVRLCCEYHITKIRSSYRMPLMWKIKNKVNKNKKSVTPLISTQQNTNLTQHSVQHLDALRQLIIWRRYFQLNGIFMTHFFDSYSSFLSNLQRGYTIPNNATIELMCHPGHPDYKIEFESILHHAINMQTKYNLISYKKL